MFREATTFPFCIHIIFLILSEPLHRLALHDIFDCTHKAQRLMNHDIFDCACPGPRTAPISISAGRLDKSARMQLSGF